MFLTKKKNHVFFFGLYFTLTAAFQIFCYIIVGWKWLKQLPLIFYFVFVEETARDTASVKNHLHMNPNICWLLLGHLTSKAEKSSFNPQKAGIINVILQSHSPPLFYTLFLPHFIFYTTVIFILLSAKASYFLLLSKPLANNEYILQCNAKVR